MKKKFNVNILARIAVLVALCVVALAVATAVNLSAMSSTRMQDRQDELVALATTAYNVVDGLGKQVDAGQLTAEAAQKAATATLSTMRYGKTGYIFVINADGVSLVNPNAPETVGKNLSENTDANGKHFTADMIAGGKANGSGFEAYQYIKVQGQPPVDKVSYYVFYKPWGWVIGTGVYLDDMAAANQADMWRGLATGGSIALVLVLAAWLLARTITGPINRITHTMETIAEGSYDVEVKGAERGDEIGKMARAVEVFRQNGVRVREMSAGELASSEERVRLRAALMQQLQKEFGQVVDAAVAGDFTQRVAETFSDAELNQLARSVNSLVNTVDVGLAESAKVLGALAKQELDERVSGDYRGAFDRLKTDINTVADKLIEIVGQLKATSGSLKLATGEILSGANDLSERTTKQAATIEETSAAMEQLAQTVMENAKRAHEASGAATTLTRTAEEGGAVMASANDAMERITQSSGKISNIIGLIDDIAFQTNLLALNASVEAARAGDAGKGFAVVAVEVRRLAQSAASASAEVKVLIEQSGSEVTGGTRLVAEAAAKLTAMVEAARMSNQLMDGIARDSREQASAIEEVTTAVRQMDEMTQHNAALVEEINASIEQTEARATDLDRIVEVFAMADAPASARRAEPARPAKATGGIKALQSRVTKAAKSYLSQGNAAVDKDWAEF